MRDATPRAHDGARDARRGAAHHEFVLADTLQMTKDQRERYHFAGVQEAKGPPPGHFRRAGL
jgi:hypothetical protein